MDINDKIWDDPIDGEWNKPEFYDHSCVYLDHEGELISFPAPEFNRNKTRSTEQNTNLADLHGHIPLDKQRTE